MAGKRDHPSWRTGLANAHLHRVGECVLKIAQIPHCCRKRTPSLRAALASAAKSVTQPAPPRAVDEVALGVQEPDGSALEEEIGHKGFASGKYKDRWMEFL